MIHAEQLDKPKYDPGRLAEPPCRPVHHPDRDGERTVEEMTAMQRRVNKDMRKYMAFTRLSERGTAAYFEWQWARLVREGFQIRRPIWTRRELAGLREGVARGSCLEPIIRDGARCWYDPEAEAHEGDFVMCELDPIMVERMRTDPKLIAANGRPTRGGTYLKRLVFVLNWWYLQTNGSLCVIGDQDGCRHRILGVLRHIEIDGEPAYGSRVLRADKTHNQLILKGDSDAHPAIGRNDSNATVTDPSTFNTLHTMSSLKFTGSFRALARLRHTATPDLGTGEWRVLKNGSTVVDGPSAISSSTNFQDHFSGEISLTAGDSFEIQATRGVGSGGQPDVEIDYSEIRARFDHVDYS